jgi:tRNA(fMet)-specific endonuclease VapC
MLDTNILIFMLRGLKAQGSGSFMNNAALRIRGKIEENIKAGTSVCVSMVTVCELEYGATKSQNPERQRRAVYKILAPFELLEADAVQLPRHYGQIRSQLEEKGQPIGAMDLMIAAHARSIGATLVTNNEKEFARVENLSVQDWSKD